MLKECKGEEKKTVTFMCLYDTLWYKIVT